MHISLRKNWFYLFCLFFSLFCFIKTDVIVFKCKSAHPIHP